MVTNLSSSVPLCILLIYCSFSKIKESMYVPQEPPSEFSFSARFNRSKFAVIMLDLCSFAQFWPQYIIIAQTAISLSMPKRNI